MRTLVGVLVAMGILLFGCSQPRVSVWHVSKRFSHAEYLQIVDAISEWCQVTRGEVCDRVEYGGRIHDGEGAVEPMTALLRRDRQLKPEVDGLYSEGSGCRPTKIFLEQSGTDDLRIVMLHELGHYLNLEHDDDPATIMHYSAGVRHISQRDLDHYCEANGCVSHLSPLSE